MGRNVFSPFLVFVTFAIIITSSSFASAQAYYADLTIDVQSDGVVQISGITNDPSLLPGTYQEFTSKKGIYWLLNISSDREFSDYILAVKLPSGAEFNYLKTSGRSRVSYDNGIKIVASGKDSLNLLVQYNINNTKKSYLYLWLLIAVVGIIILSFFSWRIFSKHRKNKAQDKIVSGNKKESKKDISKSNKSRNESKLDEPKSDEYEKIRIIKRTLAESQEKIVDLLLDAGGELIQKQLQHRSGLPKATLSRNIDILARKEIIIKQSRGMTNMIILNKNMNK